MSLHGLSIIAGQTIQAQGTTFQAYDAQSGEPLQPIVQEATTTEAHAALTAAHQAFDPLRSATPERRAAFLELFANKVEALGDALLQRAHLETALPLARLLGERGRLTGQARLFAQLIREGTWVEARIDPGQPERHPLPKPDVRRLMVPVGPVVVFGASNFPFAISIAGTDTVSALAAGCPVVAKAHPGHPGTCEMIAGVLAEALAETGLPAGAFSILHGKGTEIGLALVRHPLTAAVAFTGSLKGGRALFDAANARPHPIPFYGELGSVNPVFILPGALRERGEQLAEAFVSSLTLGVGQYCTNPGLVFGIRSAELEDWQQKTAAIIQSWAPASMLHSGISGAFHAGLERLRSITGIETVAQSETTARQNASQASAVLLTADLELYERDESLREEIFGPVSLLAKANSPADLERIAESLDGQLTASIHGTPEDLREHAPLLRILERKVGRIIFNGFGTGIEVCPSMHHGGPYPATTHPFFTSIGTAAIYRFVRPVCYQNFPDDCLPIPLQNVNTTGAWRLVDGTLTKDDIPL